MFLFILLEKKDNVFLFRGHHMTVQHIDVEYQSSAKKILFQATQGAKVTAGRQRVSLRVKENNTISFIFHFDRQQPEELSE